MGPRLIFCPRLTWMELTSFFLIVGPFFNYNFHRFSSSVSCVVGIKTINNTWFAQLYLGFSIKDKCGVK